MHKPTKQHYVPQCYLREFADPLSFFSKDYFVWIIDRDGKRKRRDKVKNVLFSNDLYTISIPGKGKDYTIEKKLQDIEGAYATIFREKISKRLPLSEEEHAMLCIFVAAMLQRTLRHKDSVEKFSNDIAEMFSKMEVRHGVPPSKSLEAKKYLKNAHKTELINSIPEISKILSNMSLAFLCTPSRRRKFITSDDPCTLFNPDLQWQAFCVPGLGQKAVQLTLPLSPYITLCLTWSSIRGYMIATESMVDDINRMTRASCYKYFISHTTWLKLVWFSRYPFSVVFMIRVFKKRVLDRLVVFLKRKKI